MHPTLVSLLSASTEQCYNMLTTYTLLTTRTRIVINDTVERLTKSLSFLILRLARAVHVNGA